MPKTPHSSQELPEPDESEESADPGPEVAQDDIEPDDYDPTEHMSAEELAQLAHEVEISQEEYEADLVRDALRSISKDAAKAYLARNGDAIDTRINALLAEAKQLAEGHPGPSLTLAATALEITIRFLLLRPLVQGAFLSDRWAAILAEDFAKGRSAEDRKILPAILKEWGIDVAKVKSPSDLLVWPFITERLWELRHRFVHRADPVETRVAVQAIDCAETFRGDIVERVASRLGFTLKVTGRWCVIQKREGKGDTLESFEVSNPFEETPKKAK